MKRVLITALVLTLCLVCAAFGAEEEVQPIWQQGTVFLLQAIGFVVTILLLKKWLFGPIGNMLEERRAKIEENYTKSEEAKSKAEADRLEYENRLHQCDEEIAMRNAAAVKEAQKQAERTVAKAAEEADRRKKMAEDEIAMEKEKAMKEVRQVAVDLGMQVAEKVIKANLSNKKNKQLAMEFIKQLDRTDK